MVRTLHQVVVGRVDVADRDDTGNARDPASALRGERGRDEGERGDREERKGAARGEATEKAELHFLQPRLVARKGLGEVLGQPGSGGSIKGDPGRPFPARTADLPGPAG